MTRRGFTLIELLVVIAVIVMLATIAVTAMAGVSHRQQLQTARVTLTTLDSAMQSYRTAYGRWPIDAQYLPAAQPPALTNGYYSELNKNILLNLRRDWGQGSLADFSADAVRMDTGIHLNDGVAYLADPWGRPYQIRIRANLKAGRPGVQALYEYSLGPDGLDDWADLETWLAAGGSWPLGDRYQAELQQNNPTSKNVDNLYLSAE